MFRSLVFIFLAVGAFSVTTAAQAEEPVIGAAEVVASPDGAADTLPPKRTFTADRQAIATSLRPKARDSFLPPARWGSKGSSALWTRVVQSSLRAHASNLPKLTPHDIADWCPAYPTASIQQREAFWVGLVSSLVKHESTFRPTAVGGGDLWFGLMQIFPSTARLYKCRATSGSALKNGPANLSCGLRIMAKTVARDKVVSRKMRGVAADWGPFHSSKKRNDMMAWTRSQSYCKPMGSLRPVARPQTLKATSKTKKG